MPRSPLFGRRIHVSGSISADPAVAPLADVAGAREFVAFSDFRTRFYPAAVAKAFPEAALGFEHLREATRATTASRVMEDR